MDNYHGADGHWVLRLYVVGQDQKCRTALANLKGVCEKHLAGHYSIEVIDLIEQPRLAQEDQIVAVPTVVRKLPPSIRKVVGDLSDMERTLVGLQLRPALPPVEQRPAITFPGQSKQDDLGSQEKWLDEGGR
jgi:circadian clock protein KaiB